MNDAQWENLARIKETLTGAVIKRINDECKAIDWRADFNVIRPQLIEILVNSGTEFADAADVFAADWYELMSRSRLSDDGTNVAAGSALHGVVYGRGKARNQVGDALRHAAKGDPQGTVDELARRAADHVSAAHNRRVAAQISNDPSVRFEVVLVGETCKTCHFKALEVESAGFNKGWGARSGEIRGALFHPNCDCKLQASSVRLPRPRKASKWTDPPSPAYRLTDENMRVFLHGHPDKPKAGWHRDPDGKNTRDGKTFIPDWMTDDEARKAMQLTLEEPQRVIPNGPGNTIRYREVDRVIWYCETYTSNDGSEVYRHMYPLNGDGIQKNKSNGVREPAPLDRRFLFEEGPIR
jgi:cellobiose-specific phosphotransferase system component IIA